MPRLFVNIIVCVLLSTFTYAYKGTSIDSSIYDASISSLYNITETKVFSKDSTVDSSMKYFISFGNSYSQTSLNGFNPNKQQPCALNPIGYPAFPGATTSGGPNWIGDLVTKYNTSLVLAYNYAYGGATVSWDLAAPNNKKIRTLEQQVEQFLKNSTVPWAPKNSLFGIWIGINDLGNTIHEPQEIVDAILVLIFEHFFLQMRILYKAGARSFVFLNVPPTDRTPRFLVESLAFQEIVRLRVTEWNLMLQEHVNEFAAQHRDAVVKLVDTVSIFTNILNASSEKQATCFNNDGHTCLWWNNYHPGVKIQNAVAHAVAETVDFF